METTVGVDAQPVDIAYTDINPPDGSMGMAVVYLHDWGCSSADFERAVEYPDLAERRLLTFDFPGHGYSTYPEEGKMGVRDLAEITHDLVTVTGLGSYALVGHGVGGLVAVRHDMRHPRHASGLVNIVGNMTAKDCFMTGKVANGTETKDTLASRFRESDNPGFKRYGEQLDAVNERAYVDLAASVVQDCESGDAFDGFATSPTPRVFMYGALASRTLNYRSRLRRKGVAMQATPNADHFPADDNPDFFFTALGKFLRGLDTHYGLI